MNSFFNFLDTKLSAPMAAMAEQRHLRAIRDGIIATLPIIIVGSFFLVIAIPPLPDGNAFKVWAAANATTILWPYRLTMFIMALYAAWGIGHSLAKSYDLDGVSGANIATVAFLLTNVPAVVDGHGFVLPLANLGGSGLFVCMLTSIFAVEVMRLVLNSKFKITMPEGVPDSVARSFENLVPMAIVIVVLSIITYWLEFDWYGIMAKIMVPILRVGDSLPGLLIPVVLITFFWFGGIHGVSIIGSLLRPMWMNMLNDNSAAYVAGEVVPYITAEPFYQWFIWIGGSGATIGLGILLAFAAKSKYAKTLGRTSIVPCLFNINEPIIFGSPIVLNPVLIVPFILAPVVNAIIAYVATVLGLVNHVVVQAPWTLPGPIGAFIATGGDWRAIVLNVLLIVLSVLIYYPFFKVYDKKELEKEMNS